jgi:hypothetical protein
MSSVTGFFTSVSAEITKFLKSIKCYKIFDLGFSKNTASLLKPLKGSG